MKNFLIDTNILVNYLRKDKEALLFLESCIENYNLATSFVCIYELLKGVRSKRHRDAVSEIEDKIMEVDYGSTNVNKNSLELFSENYLIKGLGLEDAIVAATCIEKNYVLITENLKDFKFIDGLEVYNTKQALKLIN